MSVRSHPRSMPENTPPVCDYEGSEYQEDFWGRGGREYEDQVEALALRRLLPVRGHRLLEVGAGTGRHTPRYRGFQQIVLLDYSRSQLIQAQARLGLGERFVYVLGDVYRLPFAPGVFDASTMIRTIHHMAKPEDALLQIRTVLVRGGDFILEYANKRNLKAILRWILGRQKWNPFDRGAIEFATLNFDFHPAAMRAWLKTARFEIRRQLTVSHFRINSLKRLVPTRALVALDGLLQGTGSLLQLTPSVFVLAKAIGSQEPTQEGLFWRCPICGSLDLNENETGLKCGSCGRTWPLKEGIYNFKEPI